MTPHRIHLRGFWETTSLSDGRTRHRRPFGRPGTLDPDERAWLIGNATGPVVVALNDHPLGTADGAFAFDVTDRLAVRNVVIIEAGEPLGEVVLEIRSTHSLHG